MEDISDAELDRCKTARQQVELLRRKGFDDGDIVSILLYYDQKKKTNFAEEFVKQTGSFAASKKKKTKKNNTIPTSSAGEEKVNPSTEPDTPVASGTQDGELYGQAEQSSPTQGYESVLQRLMLLFTETDPGILRDAAIKYPNDVDAAALLVNSSQPDESSKNRNKKKKEKQKERKKKNKEKQKERKKKKKIQVRSTKGDTSSSSKKNTQNTHIQDVNSSTPTQATTNVQSSTSSVASVSTSFTQAVPLIQDFFRAPQAVQHFFDCIGVSWERYTIVDYVASHPHEN